MREENVTRYVTDDGRKFDNLREAQLHELRLKVLEMTQNPAHGYICPDDIPEFVINNWQELLSILKGIE